MLIETGFDNVFAAYNVLLNYQSYCLALLNLIQTRYYLILLTAMNDVDGKKLSNPVIPYAQFFSAMYCKIICIFLHAAQLRIFLASRVYFQN